MLRTVKVPCCGADPGGYKCKRSRIMHSLFSCGDYQKG